MRVTGENWNEYEAIRDCKYQKTFPILNADAVEIYCTYGVDIEGLAAYQYAPKCKGCVGKSDCKDYESRPKEWWLK